MRRNAYRAAAFLLVMNLALPAWGQDRRVNVEKGQIVTLKIPASLFRFETTRVMNNTPIYAVDISVGLDGITVNGRKDWTMAGFPSMVELRVEKQDQKDNYLEVELRNSAGNLKLRFWPRIVDLDEAFRETVALGGRYSQVT